MLAEGETRDEHPFSSREISGRPQDRKPGPACPVHIEDSFSEPQKLAPILTTCGALHSPNDQEPRLFDFLQRPQEVRRL
jgi:hypothetical protein